MTTERKKHHPIRRARKDDRAGTNSHGGGAHAQGGTRRYGAAKKPNEIVPEGPRRERRALSHVGGEVFFQGGTEEERDALLRALDVSADENDVMADIHGFHSYPARLHPQTARGLIEALSQPGSRVLDPFCGSGTVVLEGRALGREAIGSDLNPLAVELSWLKSRGPTGKFVAEMVRAAASIAEVADERRLAKADPYRRYGDEDRERYPIHILLELDSLAHGISLLPQNEMQRMLRLVVSSMLTKLSHSEGDTTRQRAPRRLPSGFAIQLFHKKTEELAGRFNQYRSRVADKAPRAYVGTADARDLESVEPDSIDLIVTSPPYPGVYDYLEHHFHRIEWLGLRAHRLSDGEIGARREYVRLSVEDAAQQWRNEIGPVLSEMRRTLSDDGRGVMIIADSVIDRRPLRADEQIRMVAERAGIDITCVASQERPLFLYGADRAFTDRPRMEHVVVFRPQIRKKKSKDREKEDDLIARPEERPDRPERFREFDRKRMLEEDAERERREQRQGAPRRPFGERGRDDAPRGGFSSRSEGGSDREGYRGRDDAPRGGFRSREERPDTPPHEGSRFRSREANPRRSFRNKDKK